MTSISEVGLVDPASSFLAWFAEAGRARREAQPGAMTLATCDADGRVGARIVLCKDIEVEPFSLVFFTHYTTRKARDLDGHAQAAALFYWPTLKRQARVEGVASRLGDEENDACFRSLSVVRRCATRALVPRGHGLLGRTSRMAGEAVGGDGVRRPESWGGYRLVADRVELWASKGGVLHVSRRWLRKNGSMHWERAE